MLFLEALTALILSNAHALEATDIYRASRDTVVQIRTAVGPEASKRSYGSGFVVDQSGLIATNFHVIQEALNDREKYRIFVSSAGETYEASVEAIAIAADLALLKIPKKFSSALEIVDNPLELGERLYSVGVPRDLNLSVVEGTFNGILNGATTTNLLLSSPINSGMSGGPTLNRLGKVVGINVAILLESQNLSFAVPARSLAKMIRTWKGPTRKLAALLPKDNWNGIIRSQLIEAQTVLSKLWQKESKTIHFGAWKLKAPPSHLKCWRDREKMLSDSVEVEQEHCTSLFSMKPKTELTSGTMALGFAHVKNATLNPLRFPNALREIASQDSWTTELAGLEAFDVTETEYRESQCHHAYLTNKKGVKMHASYCARELKNFEDLRDVRLRAITLPPQDQEEGLVLRMELKGFQASNIQAAVSSLLESIEFHEKKN